MPTIEYDEEMGLIWADDRWMTLEGWQICRHVAGPAH